MFENKFIPADGVSARNLLVIALGSFIGIGALAYLSMEFDAPMLIASFGATAVLIYGVPKSPLAKPKNVFFGHLFSAIIGVLVYSLMGCVWYSAAIAVSFAIVVMILTGTVHPPGGATALVCVMSCASPDFIVLPVMVGVSILLAVEYVMNRFRDDVDGC